MRKTILVIVISVLVFLVVGYFIFNYTVKKITEREIRRITQQEIGRVTNQEIDRITQEEVDQITNEMIKQRTQEITNQVLGDSTNTQTGSRMLKHTECDNSKNTRQFSTDKYYGGPLFDSHIHMPFTFETPSSIYAQANWDAPILEKEVAVRSIICTFDKENVISSFGFYVVPNLLKSQATRIIPEIEKEYKDRIVPFLMLAHVSGLELTPDDIKDVLNKNKGMFKGFGEIAMYKGDFKGINPDDESLIEIYKIADEYNLIVMMHPDYGQKQAVEKILTQFPNVKFLFHGEQIGNYAAEIAGKYPNAYYTIDTDLSNVPGEGDSVSLYSSRKENFLGEFNGDYSRILNNALKIWKAPIESYPDKFLWGTDRAFDWHFDTEVGALIGELSRDFIGQLDPAAQEKFAYKNAQTLLEN